MPDRSDRVDRLLDAMSLRQKVGQLNQRLYGWQCVRRTRTGYELTDVFHTEASRWHGLGAIYGLFRADAWSGRDWDNGIAPQDRPSVAHLVTEAAREYSPHGIAPLIVEEAPHGHQALGGPLLPVNLTAAAAWDPDLYGQACAAVSAALRADGIHLALVSALDLLRDPRWGRSEECFGEDPHLGARYTRALVEGMQGPERSRVREGTGVGVVLKHFAGQGEGVAGRNGHSAHLGERDLHELHLPAARAGVAAGALGVMAAYNDIDGVPCIANAALLGGLLRRTWRFDGLVMADGKAIDRLVEILGSPSAAAGAALCAGVDLSLWDESYAQLVGTVEEHPDWGRAVDDAVRRVMGVKELFGLLGPAETGAGVLSTGGRPVDRGDQGDVRSQVIRLSTQLAERSLVLLADDRHLLPVTVTCGQRWVVVGPHAREATSLLGDYVPPLAPEERRSVVDALAAHGAARGVSVHYVSAIPSRSDLHGADLVIAVVGGTSHRRGDGGFAENGANVGPTDADCGEGVDRANLRLPHGQDEFLTAVRAATDVPVIAVVLAGRPYVYSHVLATADATVLAGYPGPCGADAVARVLTGDAQPTGRLPVSLPAHPGVVPARYNERIDPADVYHDQPQVWARPFGGGIGYAHVELTDAAVRIGEHRVHVQATVHYRRGAPQWAGPAEEVVRIHVQRRGALVWPRRSELVGFRRVILDPGERRIVHLEFDAADIFVPTEQLAPLAVAATTVTIHCGGHVRALEIEGRCRAPGISPRG